MCIDHSVEVDGQIVLRRIRYCPHGHRRNSRAVRLSVVSGQNPADETGAVGWFAIHRVGLRVSSEAFVGKAPTVSRLVALGMNLERAALLHCVVSAKR